MKSRSWILVLGLVAAWGGRPAAAAPASAAQDVAATLDHFHAAASAADGATYFSLFAPEGIFIGTDAGERWTVGEFRVFVEPYFSKGQGWTYVPRNRHVQLSPAGDVAWFDEILDSKSYGVCRGTGVLRKAGGRWLICQYHLTIPVPNGLAKAVVKMIREDGAPP